MYARGDIPIVVFDATRGNGKQCGNLVGDAGDDTERWYHHASADLAVLLDWLDEHGPKATGIATSPGKADAVVLDIDKPDRLPADWWPYLAAAPMQSTDASDPQRGHYWFDLPSGERFGNPKFPWGDVRCDGGGVILWPTPHARAAHGGRYRWVRQGEMPPLPEPIAAALRAKDSGHQGGVVLTDAQISAWLKRHDGDEFPGYLSGVHKLFRNRIEHGEKRHDAMQVALVLAMCESAANAYPARRAHDELKALWENETAADPTRKLDPREWRDMVRWAIRQAEADDCNQRRSRMARERGTHHEDLINIGDYGSSGTAPQKNSMVGRKAGKTSSSTLCLADVAPSAVRWLWKGWLPLGKVSILEGDSDVGKSTVTLGWASIVSNGSPWPKTVVNGKTLVSQHDPADVVLVGVEDANDDTVVPRLIAAGADLSRIHSLKRPINDKGEPVPFTIPNDIDWLRQAVAETRAKLVVIDPITACLPDDAKHGVDSSIRRILMHVVDLARDTDSATVLIRHFNKAAGMGAKHRGGGSVAYSALVRSVLSAGKLVEPADNGATFAIARAIGNLSKPPQSIGYRLDDAPLLAGLPEPEDDELSVSVVNWCGPIEINADQLVGADGAKVSDARKAAPMRDDAEDALREILADGPMKMAEAEAEVMRIAGCSKSTVKTAAKKMKIRKGKVYGSNGKVDYWTWELPPDIIKIENKQGD